MQHYKVFILNVRIMTLYIVTQDQDFVFVDKCTTGKEKNMLCVACGGTMAFNLIKFWIHTENNFFRQKFH